MSVWTDLTFPASSLLTSTKMTQLFENQKAAPEGAAGAPKVQTNGITDLNVTTGKLANSAITPAKLDSAGSFTMAQLTAGTLVYSSNKTGYLTLIGPDFITENKSYTQVLRWGSNYWILGAPSATEVFMHAPISLPHGAIVKEVYVNYYQPASPSGDRTVVVFYKTDMNAYGTLILSSPLTDGVSGMVSIGTCSETIQNDGTYINGYFIMVKFRQDYNNARINCIRVRYEVPSVLY